MKISAIIDELRAVKDQHDWRISNGRIEGRKFGQRRWLSPLCIALRRKLNRPRIMTAGLAYCRMAGMSNQNSNDAYMACERRTRRHPHIGRAKWVRKLILQTLDLGGSDE